MTKQKKKKRSTRPPLRVIAMLACVMMALGNGDKLRILLSYTARGGLDGACYNATINEAGVLILKPCTTRDALHVTERNCRVQNSEDLKTLRALAKNYTSESFVEHAFNPDSYGIDMQFHGYGSKQITSDVYSTIRNLNLSCQ